MILYRLSAAAAVTLLLTGCIRQPSDAPGDAAIAAELKEINRTLETLEQQFIVVNGTQNGESIKIPVLPSKPTRAEADAYMAAIGKLLKKQKSHDSYNQQLVLLRRIDAPNWEAMVPYLDQYQVRQALIELLKPEHKKRVLELLPANPALTVTIPYTVGYDETVLSPVFLKMLTETKKPIPTWYVNSYLRMLMKQPDFRQKAREILLANPNTFGCLYPWFMSPKEDFSELLKQIWKNYGTHPDAPDDLAYVAAQNGIKEALPILIERYSAPKKMSESRRQQLRTLLKQELPPPEMKVWFDKAYPALQFDLKTKSYQ